MTTSVFNKLVLSVPVRRGLPAAKYREHSPYKYGVITFFKVA